MILLMLPSGRTGGSFHLCRDNSCYTQDASEMDSTACIPAALLKIAFPKPEVIMSNSLPTHGLTLLPWILIPVSELIQRRI